MKFLLTLSLASIISISQVPQFSSNNFNSNSTIFPPFFAANAMNNVKTKTNKSRTVPDIITNQIYSKDDLLEVNLKVTQIRNLENSDIAEKINKKFLNDALKFKSEVEIMAKENSQDAKKHGLPSTPFAAFSDYKITYNKNDILSLYIDYYQFTGGAHGSTLRKCYNYNLITGQEFTLNNLFKTNSSYKEIINEEIREQINKNKKIYFPEYFKGISDNQCFTIDNNNLIIYFQQYDIAPYATGIPEFKIPLSKFNTNLEI